MMLQYTANVTQEIDFSTLFLDLHHVISDVAGIRIGNCKSRAVRLEHFCVGQGDPTGGFVHLDVRFLEGRTLAVKGALGRALLKTLEAAYAPSIAEHALQITVEIQDIQRGTYFKFPGGTYFKFPGGTLTPQ